MQCSSLRCLIRFDAEKKDIKRPVMSQKILIMQYIFNSIFPHEGVFGANANTCTHTDTVHEVTVTYHSGGVVCISLQIAGCLPAVV